LTAAYDTTQTNMRMEALRPLLFLESDLDPTQLERLAKTMTAFATPPGATVFTQGDKVATMYYITQGQLSFFRKPSNGRMKATAIALQKQFEIEERTNALESAKHATSVEAASPAEAAPSDSRKHVTAAERRNAFLEMSALMDIGNT
jgi:CRP-like cAMP-binding protein